ncbi:uncharacterized protein LOC134203218 [Armigeres subalbatus]|uniref:uncharacterized protein LOC134203218 n=1 Tax=Armigeres subalbatus TaxID=124917 RepID=UPI002ED5B7DE
MADNYRKDAAFGSIDSSKVHLRYAQVVVINIEKQSETSRSVIHRLKVLLDKSRELNSAGLHDSLICLQNFLDFYIHKKDELMAANSQRAHPIQTGIVSRFSKQKHVAVGRGVKIRWCTVATTGSTGFTPSAQPNGASNGSWRYSIERYQ